MKVFLLKCLSKKLFLKNKDFTPLSVTLMLAGSSSILGCKIGSVVEPFNQSQLKASSNTSNEFEELQKFCDSAVNVIGNDYKEEIGYLCDKDEKKKAALKELAANAYNGQGDASRAISQIKLESKGEKTSFAFVGALLVPKNLKELELVRKKSLEVGVFDTQWSIEVNYKLAKDKTATKEGQGECYDINEYTKDPFGSTNVPLKACFYNASPKTSVSYQGKGDTNYVNKTIFVRIETKDQNTLILASISKDVNNRKLTDIAEGVVKGQAPQLVTQYYNILKQAPEAQTLPQFVSKSVTDYNYINVTEDWSWDRTKLSCKPNQGIYGIRQTSYTPLKPKALLQIECGASMAQEAENKYRYVEASQKFLPDAEIQCADDEYAAGVSYLRYSDNTHTIDGVKSLLCMGKKTKKTTCQERDEVCESGEYLKGVTLRRVFGFICDGKRQDDDGTGCYRVKKVNCCR